MERGLTGKLAHLVRRRAEQVLPHVQLHLVTSQTRVHKFLQIEQVVLPGELDILKLSEVSDVEKSVPVHPNLRFYITTLKIDTVL